MAKDNIKLVTLRVSPRMHEMMKLVSTLYGNKFSHYVIQLIENDLEKNWNYYMEEIEKIRSSSEKE